MRPDPRRAAGLTAALALAAPVLLGVAYLVRRAFSDDAGTWTAARVLRLAGDTAVWRALGWSAWTALAATLLAAAAATALAITLRARTPSDRVAHGLALLPLPVPHLVAAALGVLLFASSGLLARVLLALGLLPSLDAAPVLLHDRAGLGVILVLAWKELPFLLLTASAALAQRGAGLEEAARTLGATPWQCVRFVTWPLLRRSLAPALLAVFAFAAGCWEIAALLGPSDPLPWPVLLHERATDPALATRGDADALALLALGIGLVLVALHEWLRARTEAAA